ncbi:MAG TPA: lysylphosphatidylglycerol synthase domain-containing protein, partial [Dokdonella sp.]
FASAMLLPAAAVSALALRRPLARALRRWTAAPRLARLHEPFAAALRDVARLLGDPRAGAGLALSTTLQWSARYGVLWAALAALGHEVPYSVALLAQALVLHAAQWTGVPSGAGAAELGLAAALAHWIDPAAFATAALVWRCGTLYGPLLAGGVAMLWLTRRLPLARAAEPAAEAAGYGA